MATIEISSIITQAEAQEVMETIERHQKLIRKMLTEKDERWNMAQFAEFFRIMAAENLLNFYSTHTPDGYIHALSRWKKAEEATQKAYREENFI
jgi:ERCC4-related helicase